MMSPTSLPECPYVGLTSFDEGNAQYFFGRDRERQVIVANLRGSRLTLLYGPSGVGKTSALRAGAVYDLKRRRESARRRRASEYRVVYFNNWRDDPVAGLLATVENAIQGTEEFGIPVQRDAAVTIAPSIMVDSLAKKCEQIDGQLLIILDQFEEFFLYHSGDSGTGSFTEEFARTVNRADLPVHFLVSFREDALAKLDHFKGRIPTLFDNYLRVDHLDEKSARAAINGPLAKFNEESSKLDIGSPGTPWAMDAELSDAVIKEVQAGRVFLKDTGRGTISSPASGDQIRVEAPFLQLVMTRMWQKSRAMDTRRLDVATFDGLGGARSIVRNHLSATLGSLDREQVSLAARMLDRLVTPSGAKITQSSYDLAVSANSDEQDVIKVLEFLSSPATRIVRPVAPAISQPDTPRYEIAHDVLGPAVLDWRQRWEDEQREAQSRKPTFHFDRGESAAVPVQHVYDVFLAYNDVDTSAVETIAMRLRDQGFVLYLDRWNLKAGEPWQKALVEALRRSASAAVFLGASTDGTWWNQEMQLALLQSARQRDDFRVIPVLLPGADPKEIDGFFQHRTWIDFQNGLDDDVAFQRLTAAIKGVASDASDGWSDLPDEPSPYRGLERFETEDHEIYFGRGEEIQQLIARLERDRFVAIVGASGSGKSSLARAGLCTALAEQQLPGIRNWRRLTMLPGNRPLESLAHTLVTHLPINERSQVLDELNRGFHDGTIDLSTAIGSLFPPDTPLLLLVDQLEELFTHSAGAEDDARSEQGLFLDILLNAHESRIDGLRILVTIRADFLERFLDSRRFAEMLQDRQFLLGQMTEDDLRETIVYPARIRGAFFEKGLVELILADMRWQSSSLPLLQFALMQLWDARRGPWLTHQAYQKLGGIAGSLSQRADHAFETLSPSDQEICRNLFLRLIQLGEGRDSGRRVLRTELDASPDIDRVIDRLVDHRLIITDGETLEIAHVSLVRNWDRLTRWIDANREDMRFTRRLSIAAQDWANTRDSAFLLRGSLLDEAVRLRAEQDFLTHLESEFISVSLEHVHRQRRQLNKILILTWVLPVYSMGALFTPSDNRFSLIYIASGLFILVLYTSMLVTLRHLDSQNNLVGQRH